MKKNSSILKEQNQISSKLVAQRPLLYFDGACYLCNRSIQFILANEKNDALCFAPLSSRISKTVEDQKWSDTNHFDSLIFIENGREFQKFDAVMRLSKYLRFPYSLLIVLRIIPTSIGNIFYNYIAKNRNRWFKNEESCWVINPKNESRFLTSSIVT